MAGKNKNNKNKDANLMKEVCLVCNGKVGNNDKGISCEMCEYWFHAKCIKMDDELYEFYTNEETTWVCKVCVKIVKVGKTLRELLNEMTEMHEETWLEVNETRLEVKETRLEVKKERDEALKDRTKLTEIMKIMTDKIDELA